MQRLAKPSRWRWVKRIAAGIAVVIIAAVQAIGTNLSATFQKVASAVK